MKPKLIPMKVPWQVAPAVPDLGVRLSSELEETVEVEFIGNYVLAPTDESRKFSNRHEIIVVTFKTTYWINTYPNLDDQSYDWSEVDPDYHDRGNTEKEFKDYTEEWLSSGIAPLPGFYQVQHSEWIPKATSRLIDYKNYLFLGENLSVEVFGNTWTWHTKKILDFSGETEGEMD